MTEAAGALARIDLAQLQANWRALDAASGPAQTGAAVKADAYGHGLAPAARAFAKAGCRSFFVATFDEGAALRDALGAGPDIYVLNGPLSQTDLAAASDATLRPVLNSVGQVRLFLDNASDDATAALQVDSGMRRLGVAPDEAVALAGHAERFCLVMSHLACADEAGHPQNAAQLRAFREVAAHFPGVRRSLSATGGILLGDDYRFDLTRPGIGLYGGGPAGEAGLVRPAIDVSGVILKVFDARPGDHVGYGATYAVDRPMRLATVALGYADGVLRSASNRGYAVAGGRRRPFVGRVSMDLTVIDVTEAPDVAPGDRAVFLGGPAGLGDPAEAARTIDYELLTGIGARVQRTYDQ